MKRSLDSRSPSPRGGPDPRGGGRKDGAKRSKRGAGAAAGDAAPSKRLSIWDSNDAIEAQAAAERHLFETYRHGVGAAATRAEPQQIREVQIPQKLVEYVMTPENRQLLTEETGADVECFPDTGKVILTGSDVNLKNGVRLLSRVEMHCHWGVNEEKVKRLLKPPMIDSVLVRLSPMTEHLRLAEKTLTQGVTCMNIGKDKSMDVVVNDQLASRAHCMIQLDPAKGVYIADLSTNGTYLNGHRLPAKKLGKVLLSHGDEILLRDPSRFDSEFGYMVNLNIIADKKEAKLEAGIHIDKMEWASRRRLNPCGIL